MLSLDFHCKENDRRIWFLSYTHTPRTCWTPQTVTLTIITGDESWVYRYDPETKFYCHFPYNENPTRALNTTSLKCCLPSTDTIKRQEKIHACIHMKIQGCLMQACFIEIHQVFAKKKKGQIVF